MVRKISNNFSNGQKNYLFKKNRQSVISNFFFVPTNSLFTTLKNSGHFSKAKNCSRNFDWTIRQFWEKNRFLFWLFQKILNLIFFHKSQPKFYRFSWKKFTFQNFIGSQNGVRHQYFEKWSKYDLSISGCFETYVLEKIVQWFPKFF